MQQYLKKGILLNFCFPNFFVATACFLCLAFFALSPVIGMDLEDDKDLLHQTTHQLNESKDNNALEIEKEQNKIVINKQFKDNNDLEVRQENNKIITDNIPLLLTQLDLLYQHDENPLIPYIQRYVISDQQVEENLWARRVRIGIKIFTLVYGSAGGIPYISACCNAAQGVVPLCIAFAGGNVVASGAATMWVGNYVVKSLLDPISKEEKDIVHLRTRWSIFKHVACNVLGILASVPGTYSVYKYNTGIAKFLVIPGFLNNYFFSAAGYYEITHPRSMFQQILFQFKNRDEIGKKSSEIKENLINQLQNHVIPSIIEDDKARDELFTEDLTNVHNVNSAKDFIGKSLTLNCPANTIEPPEKWKSGYPRKIVQGMSLIFPLGNAIVNYFLGYEAANLLIESSIFCNGFSATVVIPNFMLDVLSSTTTASQLFDAIYNKARKRTPTSLMSSFYPKLNFVIPFVSLTLASLSVTGGLVVSHDVIANSSLKSLSYILPWVVFVSNAMSQSFQMRDLLHDAINYFSTFRKDNVGETARKINRLERFIAVISNCVPSIFYDFWNYFKSEQWNEPAKGTRKIRNLQHSSKYYPQVLTVM